MLKPEFLVIGGGIIGVNIAIYLKQLYPKQEVVIIDKEDGLGCHASGRNSGVLHAGFYYSSDSLKARFTREGNALMTRYCKDKKLKINNCGKLVIATNQKELEGLYLLKKRAEVNNVVVDLITEKEAMEIDPFAKSYQCALWSPTTSAVDPVEVLTSLLCDAKELGVKVFNGTSYIRKKGNIIITSKHEIEAGYVINCAGLYADKIAKDFGFAKNYKIIPFKGIYLYADESSLRPRTHIYPVPDMELPFLGVHYTLTADGRVKIGPTSIPAFWRENYSGLKNFNLMEMLDICLVEAKLLITNSFKFRDLAFQEIQKFYKPKLIAEATRLCNKTANLKFTHWGKSGIRAQLYDVKANTLEMDFKFEGDERSFHVLNAVSPAFTCSMSFGKYLVNEISHLRNSI